MKDFAYWLRHLREEAGLNQKELAERVGYTGSYISMLESRKKPPPSDEVVRRLAQSLGVEERQLLEFAHLERTPYDIKQQFQSLRRRMESENRLADWLDGPFTHRLLPILLHHLVEPPPGFERTEAAHAPPADLRRFHRRLQAAAQRSEALPAFLEEATELVSALDADQRTALLEWLPTTIAPGSGSSAAAPSLRLPIFIEVPWEPVAVAAEKSGGWKAVPESLYAPGRYCLIASGPAMYPRIEEGDFVIVDETMVPESGDLVAVIAGGTGQILRYIEAGEAVELAPINPTLPPIRVGRDSVGAPGGPTLRGVVVEIHRELK